jgi:hypothetical protein
MLSSREAAATNSPDIIGNPHRGQFWPAMSKTSSSPHLETAQRRAIKSPKSQMTDRAQQKIAPTTAPKLPALQPT